MTRNIAEIVDLTLQKLSWHVWDGTGMERVGGAINSAAAVIE